MMKAITLILTAATMLLVTHSAAAGQHSKSEHADKQYKFQRGGHAFQKMLAGVELSAEQRQQLQQLLAAHRANKPERERAKEQRAALRQLMQADYFDETAVTEQLQQQQQQRLIQRVAQLKLRHQVQQLLTPEQREQLASSQQQRKQKWLKKHKAAAPD